jgi:hypothetical protein
MRKKPRILIACEFSGIVRDSFRVRGHNAISCDLLPSERKGPHIQGNVFDILQDRWDMMIAFYPCTNLASSGARWLEYKGLETLTDVANCRALLDCDIPRICLENPVGVLSSFIRKPDQRIQPWQFGHGEVKKTCFWLVNLPLLKPTQIVKGRTPRVHYESAGPNRWKNRSRTLQGIADAMAEQWGKLL